MYFVLLIAVLVCIFLIADILISPAFHIKSIQVRIPYWFIPMVGALLLLFSGRLGFGEAAAGLTGSGTMNPIKILILFISMTMLSVFLDEAGMFRYLAGCVLTRAGSNQRCLFFYLYLMVAVLTVFTSNDVIILTFTPFICYFSKNAGIDPMPFLFGEFVAANTWSMMLVIGNPTNIYLAAAAGITFGGYTAVMLLPTILAGMMAYAILLFVFRRQLSAPMQIREEHFEIDDKLLVVIGVAHLGLCTILLVLSSYIGFEMWKITLGFAISLFAMIAILQFLQKRRIIRTDKKTNVYTRHILRHTLRRAPWELIPFVISMFLLVLSLEKYGWLPIAADALGTGFVAAKYGIASFLMANVINNIPMSVAFSRITGCITGLAGATDEMYRQAVFASIIGSNIGAYFTPLGALAGIMWSGILRAQGISFSFAKYVRYGICIAPFVLATALAGMWFVLNYVMI